MSENPVTNESFSKTNPKLQIAWDSTSIGALSKCPRLYEYTIIEGYSSPYGEKAHLEFGTFFHSATEEYERHKAAGKTHDQSLCEAIRRALTDTWNFDLKRPWLSSEPTKTRFTLLRTIVWYLDHFKDENLKTLTLPNGKLAVELPFRLHLGDVTENNLIASTGEPYLLCGMLDRAVEWNEKIYITDKKTTKYDLDDRYFQQYSPNIQVSVYTIAGMIILDTEIDGLIIDGIQTLVSGSRFRRRPIPRSVPILEEFLQNLQIMFRENEVYAENNFWPMRETSCGFGKMQCSFRSVCSADPEIRKELLETGFVKRMWDPLTRRSEGDKKTQTEAASETPTLETVK